MGRKSPDKCDALYCHEDAVVGVQALRGDGTKTKLCVKHWLDHCEDRIVELAAGRKLMPVPLISAAEGIVPTVTPRVK